jgi:hypothetical protein
MRESSLHILGFSFLLVSISIVFMGCLVRLRRYLDPWPKVGNVVLVDLALRIVHRVIAHGVDSVMVTLGFIA